MHPCYWGALWSLAQAFLSVGKTSDELQVNVRIFSDQRF
jgi:hypothetical protein